MNRFSQRGLALVITLIMLSIITVIAVTLLAVSQRERVGVGLQASQTDAELMANAALERAKAQIAGAIMSRTNLLAGDLAVSVNSHTPARYEIRTITNLQHDPRPPVFVHTNTLSTARDANTPLDFRFYLDLNRNGRYDTNGYQYELDRLGRFVRGTNNLPLTNFFVGDPEWIGMLYSPALPHSKTNQFVGRFAFLIAPAGRSLDLNYIHNHSKAIDVNAGYGYHRNQGIGTWELNLAAFLADLNTNLWNHPFGPYNYVTNVSASSTGDAFIDAKGLLLYRYGGSKNLLSTFRDLFGPSTIPSLESLDVYAERQALTLFGLPSIPIAAASLGRPWEGADNANRLSTPYDLFDREIQSAGLFPGFNFRTLSRHLEEAGRPDPRFPRPRTSPSSYYDRYTFYRMLGQIGTDSVPESPKKINLNYINQFGYSSTNLLSWTRPALPASPASLASTARPSTLFFNTVAGALLADLSSSNPNSQPPIAITNIMVYPTNYFTPAIHRLLQVTANLYDASTNRLPAGLNPLDTPFYPTIFRPVFTVMPDSSIVITSYDEVEEGQTIAMLDLANWKDLSVPAQRAELASTPMPFVHGIPPIVGAKKGWPNFNEVSMQTHVHVTRKVQVSRDRIGAAPNRTNQMFQIGISNIFGVEAWNSYTQDFRRPLGIRIANVMNGRITDNTVGRFDLPPRNLVFNEPPTIVPSWKGNEFQIPLLTNVSVLPTSVYKSTQTPHLEPLKLNYTFTGNDTPYDVAGTFAVPQISVAITNKFLFWLLDGNRVVDVVSIMGMNDYIDVASELSPGPRPGAHQVADKSDQFWRTNRVNNTTGLRIPYDGITNQIHFSMLHGGDSDLWVNYNAQPVGGMEKEKAIDGFIRFMQRTNQFPLRDPTAMGELEPQSNVRQVPFSPTRVIIHSKRWQVDDPLVHYRLEHLQDRKPYEETIVTIPRKFVDEATNSLGAVNARYRPWGGNPSKDQAGDPASYDLRVKDPLIYQSDDWDFLPSAPMLSTKFPTLGWLGRVHRGTPWQTLYLKSYGLAAAGGSPAQEVDPWIEQFPQPELTHPTNDWRILDLFTVALHENAARGQLSVNQNGVAAWSAVLSGVTVVSNSVDDTIMLQAGWASNPIAKQKKLDNFTNSLPQLHVIEPASPQLHNIVNGINQTRRTRQGQVFSKMGDVLASPELTVNSPFLNTSAIQRKYGISDQAYEFIPQQVMSLLTVGDARYVIYAFGQALKPAENSIMLNSGPYYGICTNYQITAEVATRTVLRMEAVATNSLGQISIRPFVEDFKFLPNH